MIDSRTPEITIKFSEKPELPAEGKKATIAFKSENGLKIEAIVTRKTAAKQLKKVEEFANWIGAVNGKIYKIENGIIFVADAGLQIFERRKRSGFPSLFHSAVEKKPKVES